MRAHHSEKGQARHGLLGVWRRMQVGPVFEAAGTEERIPLGRFLAQAADATLDRAGLVLDLAAWLDAKAVRPAIQTDGGLVADGSAETGIRSTMCYSRGMSREITQRELRNESGKIMRELDRGESFVVTRAGVPVGELVPMRRRRFVRADAAVAAFRGASQVDFDSLRRDLDVHADQDATPRG